MQRRFDHPEFRGLNSCRTQERDGWYSSHAFERIKTVLRHKFFSLLEGHPATDEESRALLVTNEGAAKSTVSNRSHKLRAGKHNMAKGALRPEDAAVSFFFSFP
jgi:general transcription factor 3C polypeptide 5 (transcription factor C subunit 1)